ncbi:hypothetical protein QP927_08550 [Corynebacterium pseudodiphtheriticum]|uniref:hypothetical protein n=1 Tax=Corynebacterium pseudodiphtheriticum TaxID=37637 RepID=UPI00254A128D|nr:hypothetical protein [Corynebacterium pseudodiphtheriticum]MDK8478914.1 hypothetical protein [Corynebacterium pseudodiphtheriticum]
MFTFDAETLVQELASAVADRVAWHTEFYGIHDNVHSEIDCTLTYKLDQLSDSELNNKLTVQSVLKAALLNYEIDETVLTSVYTADLQEYWEDNRDLVDSAIAELGGLHGLGAETIDGVITQGVWAAVGIDVRRAIDETYAEVSELVERVFNELD